MAASASQRQTRSYRRIAREILAEAARIAAEEDERYGPAQGDELPERLRTAEGRTAALREAKRQLEAERAAAQELAPDGEASAEVEAGCPGSRCRWIQR